MGTFTKEDSYAERRQIFKNVWDDDVDGIKPKVIKTLRLDDMNKFVIGKSRKEKLKNLRTICNKILDFCDRQETDMLFGKNTREAGLPSEHLKPRRLKIHAKRKIKRRKSLYAAFNPELSSAEAKATTSELEAYATNVDTSKDISPFVIRRMPVTARPLISNDKSNLENTDTVYNPPEKVSKTRRRIVKRKRIKRKKIAESTILPTSGSSKNCLSANQAAVKGRVVLRHIKQVLAVNKIVIAKPESQ